MSPRSAYIAMAPTMTGMKGTPETGPEGVATNQAGAQDDRKAIAAASPAQGKVNGPRRKPRKAVAQTRKKSNGRKDRAGFWR